MNFFSKVYGVRIKSLATGVILLLPNIILASEGVELTPGLWEIQSSTHLPAMSQSVSNRVTRCLKNSEYDPSNMFDDDQQCSVSNKLSTGNSMTWLLQCTIPKAHGRGEFSSQGDHAEGATSLWIVYRGRDVEMITKWSGHRTGECKSP